MRSIACLILMLCCVTTAVAQREPLTKSQIFINVAELLPEEVEVKGSTQGFAIYGRYGFSIHDKGQCVIIDMKRRKYVTTFMLDGNTGHCNNASFGVERYSAKSQFPLLYVTECRGERACYVNDISLSGSRMVQKILYDGDDITGPADWLVDRDNNLIYLYCTIGKTRTLKCFALPRLADSDASGEVHLKAEDAIYSISAGEITIPQGSHIHRGRVYLPDGIPPRPTRLHITDVKSGASRVALELTHTSLEPEGVATRGKWLYLSFHTPGDARANVIYRYRIRR